MYYIRENEGDRAFNDLLCEVQQQFLAHKERTNRKFQKLEETIELAAQKMSLLRSIQAKHQKRGFVTPANWNANARHDRNVQQPGVIPDSVPHLELKLPKFEGAEVFECSQHCEHQLAAEPIYDEESGEGQECWPENEFILAALRGDHSNLPKSLQSEGCYEDKNFNILRDGENTLSLVHNGLGEELELPTPEQPSLIITRPKTPKLATHPISHIPTISVAPLRPLETKQFEISIERITVLVGENDSGDEVKSDMKLRCYRLVPGHGDMPGSYKVEDKQSAGEEVFSRIPTNMREIVKTFHRKIIVEGFLTVKGSYGLGKSNFGEANALIFDPCGHESTAVSKIVKELFKNGVKLDGMPVIIVACDRLEQLHDQDIQEVSEEIDGFDKIISEINQQFVDSVKFGLNALTYEYGYTMSRKCGPEINKSVRLENKKASRRSVVITVFDPGGFLSFYTAQFDDCSAGILNDQPMVTRCSQWKSDIYERKRNHNSRQPEALLVVYLIQVKGSGEGKQEVAMMASAYGRLQYVQKLLSLFCHGILMISADGSNCLKQLGCSLEVFDPP